MLCTRVAVLQRKENVQIQTSHSKCKHKKKSCENKIKVIYLPNVAFYHHIICTVSKKTSFDPKGNNPDRENVEI